MRKRLLMLFLIAVFASPMFAAAPAIDAHKKQSIHTLLELTGIVKVVDQMIGQMFDSYATNMPEVPPEAWQKLRSRMKAEDLVDQIVPVYDKYYTQDDLDGMIAFYRTPVGQKVVRTLPEISREGFAIGQEWGKRKGEEVIKELRAEGLLKQ